MKLVYFSGRNGERNFGDELGPWLWDRLLPGAFDDDPAQVFLGIGTLLDERVPAAARVIVFGSGVGYGTGVPRPHAGWSIYALRGPLSADALGVNRSLAITDPGALVRRFRAPDRSAVRQPFAYMPHWRCACDDWRRVCERIGYGYIDPRGSVEQVLDEIQHTGVLVAEAMHGAIVADALRVPWIPVRSVKVILDFKWRDWCASLDLPYEPHRIVPVWRSLPHPTLVRRARHAARLAAAAAWLRALGLTARPVLSDEALLTGRLDGLDAALERFKADLQAGRIS